MIFDFDYGSNLLAMEYFENGVSHTTTSWLGYDNYLAINIGGGKSRGTIPRVNGIIL